MGNNMKAKKRVSLYKKQSVTGWAFLLPATLLIFAMNFYPMLQAFILSFKTGIGNNQTWGGLSNYARLLKDGVFRTAITNNFFYLIIQVPVMLILAIFLACLLNKKDLRGKGIYRTMIFLPCCTALVSYSIIFKTLFAYDGYINTVLLKLGLIGERINWLGDVDFPTFGSPTIPSFILFSFFLIFLVFQGLFMGLSPILSPIFIYSFYDLS